MCACVCVCVCVCGVVWCVCTDRESWDILTINTVGSPLYGTHGGQSGEGNDISVQVTPCMVHGDLVAGS
jgi:hypothetical protein